MWAGQLRTLPRPAVPRQDPFTPSKIKTPFPEKKTKLPDRLSPGLITAHTPPQTAAPAKASN
jgi:hypothetical protein